MNGRRVYPVDRAGGVWYAPGDYGLDTRAGCWYARPPMERAHLGSLANHEVTEHADGTISVTPSILITGEDAEGDIRWHGYLERGLWR